MSGAHANAARAKIVRVCLFLHFTAPGFPTGEAHPHHDGQSLFRSSGQVFVEIHTVTCRAIYCLPRPTMFAPQLNWLGPGPSVESQVRGVWARAWTVNVCVCLVSGASLGKPPECLPT